MKYSILLIDPPWKYNSKANHKTRFRGGAYGHYNLMGMEEIKQLRISDLGDKNSVLFMWCTFPYIDKQIQLFSHWGYRYRTLGFSWIKVNKKNGEPFFGVGYYAKSNAEVCLMGMRGQLKPVSNKVSSVVISPRREHSRKPDEVRERIVTLFGDLPRIELFARQKTEGWDSIGFDIDGRDITESIGIVCDKQEETMKDVLCSKGCGGTVRINDSSIGGVCGNCVMKGHIQLDGKGKKTTEEFLTEGTFIEPETGNVFTLSKEDKKEKKIFSQEEIDKGMEKVIMNTEMEDPPVVNITPDQIRGVTVEPKTIKLSQVSKEPVVVEPKKESMRQIVLKEFKSGKSRVEILGFLKLSYPDITDKKASALVSAYLSALKSDITKRDPQRGMA